MPPPVRFITSFAVDGEQCITVLDTGEAESDGSRCRRPLAARRRAGSRARRDSLLANVLNADEYGVWVSGIAPVRDDDGCVVAAVTVDAPAVSRRRSAATRDRSQTLAAMLRAAAIRFSRAEVEAMTDGLTGLYNHRYLHERLQEELERAQRQGSRSPCSSVTATSSRATTTSTGTRPATPPLRASRASSRPIADALDLAARYGGEEFVLALIDTDGAGALTAAETIRTEIESVSAATADR